LSDVVNGDGGGQKPAAFGTGLLTGRRIYAISMREYMLQRNILTVPRGAYEFG
jgi:hypothetical protein